MNQLNFQKSRVNKYNKPCSRTNTRWLGSLLFVVPVVVIGLNGLVYLVSGPSFKIGGGTIARDSNGKLDQGNNVFLVYTSSSYNEKILLDWLSKKSYFGQPWSSSNYQNSALFFTNSMQLLKWKKFEDVSENNTIATICRYESDKSTVIHQGYFDCFEGHETLLQQILKITEQKPSGFGGGVDGWYAKLEVCQNVQIPDESVGDIEIVNMCRRLIKDHDQDIEKFIQWFGEGSEQLKYMQSKAIEYGIQKKPTK
jgi:hypothetical protein